MGQPTRSSLLVPPQSVPVHRSSAGTAGLGSQSGIEASRFFDPKLFPDPRYTTPWGPTGGFVPPFWSPPLINM
jgi:hypothetical protein